MSLQFQCFFKFIYLFISLLFVCVTVALSNQNWFITDTVPVLDKKAAVCKDAVCKLVAPKTCLVLHT